MLSLFAVALATAQSANTLTLGAATSPAATLKQVEWLAGHWRGEAFGGSTEEIWSPALGGSMMCSFKLVKDNKVSFYEFVTMIEEAGSLVVRLKHFHSDLKGWEEKDKTIDFPLVKIDGKRAYFDGMTFENTGPNDLTIYVMIGKKGEEKEMPFLYKRVK